MHEIERFDSAPLPAHIVDEKTGLHYTLYGDYYFPDLGIPIEPTDLSRWGQMALQYMKEHATDTYYSMISNGTLADYLHNVDHEAQERFDTLMEGYKRCWGITEALKASDQMKWVGLMNLARAEAEHSIMTEMICTEPLSVDNPTVDDLQSSWDVF